MNAILLKNGNMIIPVRAEGPNGELGDSAIEITPDHPDYQRWLKFAKKED
jgi:hypothetical protein